MEKQLTGWANPRPFAGNGKFHYFDEGRSLCRKWMKLGGEFEDDKDDHPDNCATCKKKVKALRASAAE